MLETVLRTGSDTKTVLLVDDHAMVAEGLGAALSAYDGISVVGVAVTVGQGLTMAAGLQPDVVVLDSSLPDGDAPDAIARFLEVLPSGAVIVLGSSSDYNAVVRALEAGARGFLVKDQRVAELADAVRAVTAGGRVLAAQLVDALVDRLSTPAPRRFNLTNREIDVLNRLAAGASTATISEQLLLSVNTVRNHVQSAIRRLGAHSKLEAISIARREGLLDGVGQSA
jgi:DNA-binding NarL/FixJ family response regulator